jgi:hypothetical protein
MAACSVSGDIFWLIEPSGFNSSAGFCSGIRRNSSSDIGRSASVIAIALASIDEAGVYRSERCTWTWREPGCAKRYWV